MKKIVLILAVVFCVPLNAFAASTLIYDAAQGSPLGQGWTLSNAAKGTYQVSNGLLTYDSTGYPVNEFYRFYKALDFDLDHTVGFSIEFSAQVHSNYTNFDSRSGFVLYFFAHDSQALQIYFATDRIFYNRYDPTYASVKEEEYFINTTSALVDYRVEVLNNSFALYANNTEILNGTLYDYGYSISNTLYIGDHTQSAYARASFGSILVTSDTIPTPPAAIPEPVSVVTLICGLAGLMRRLIRTA
ncbi:MAG: hypothetical protein C4541_06830 [Candidatus Auribacter fodinae]|jgi:hypothetical protein|uniref:PEP-CTERM sorting domain-containing protein n=1 Tax=Candidatus Auribacter fodinae TaxID=2093366 RepID=A0A3A4R293_9BACT|nr:MAG: hypothetical protein C4541_06830 [Candidatus Auribacter fodinae]